MSPNSAHERLEFLLAQLPPTPGRLQRTPSPAYVEGHLCAALCRGRVDEPVAALDSHWGEDWAEALVEQELLDEFMTWLEERWQELQHALDADRLRQDPDALPLADALAWAGHDPVKRTGQAPRLPDAAHHWACGFLDGAAPQRAEPCSDKATAELLDVIAALTLAPGAPLLAYLQRAYERPQEVDAMALLDDALFAAQDLRLASGTRP